MILSLLCLVHCLVLPVAIAVVPAATHFLDLPEEVHAMIFFIAAPISALAIAMGVRRHGLWLPAALASSALLLIAWGAFGNLPLLLETGISVAGSLLLLVAHVLNLRFSRLSKPTRLTS